MWKLYSTLYNMASHPCQEGRLFVTVQYLKSLSCWGFSCSPVQGGSFVNFLGLVIAGKTHIQSPILKTKGAFSNTEILRYLQSCILHTLNKLPAYCNFDPKGVFSVWRTWACIIPLELVGSVSGKVGSHKQVDLPIHRLQHKCWVTNCPILVWV